MLRYLEVLRNFDSKCSRFPEFLNLCFHEMRPRLAYILSAPEILDTFHTIPELRQADPPVDPNKALQGIRGVTSFPEDQLENLVGLFADVEIL